MTEAVYHYTEDGVVKRIDYNWTDAAIQTNHIISQGLPESKWSAKQKRDRDTIHAFLSRLFSQGYVLSYDTGIVEWAKIEPKLQADTEEKRD